MLFDFNSVSPEMRAVLEPVACRHAQEHLPEDCPASLQFVQMPGISPECCVVTGYGSQMTLAASDTLGFLCGLGKCLRRIASGEPMQRTLRFTPQKKLRGVYFATHFGNWYVSAPEEEVERYIEDLALWGMNTLAVWYDIHAFSGVDDPGAAALRDRLHSIFRVCRRLGIRTLLGMLANEAFSTSDPTLRADWRGNQNGYTSAPQGHYHVEYCPSVPGGMRAILETKAAVLGEFRDCPPDAVWLWPYDQGGCTCARCAPLLNSLSGSCAERRSCCSSSSYTTVPVCSSATTYGGPALRDASLRCLRHLYSTTPAIFPKYTAEGSKAFPPVSTRRGRCWDLRAARSFLRSCFCR